MTNTMKRCFVWVASVFLKATMTKLSFNWKPPQNLNGDREEYYVALAEAYFQKGICNRRNFA